MMANPSSPDGRCLARAAELPSGINYIIAVITAPLAGLQAAEVTAEEPNCFSLLLQHNV